MRILQLIDSLEAGGAERMAVNYANALSEKIAFSALVATRKEGILKKQLKKEVPYLFLEKKKIVDWKALFRLRRFVNQHQVAIIHAHSTSFFLAVLLKFTLPKIKIIWHDHYGNSEFLDKRSTLVLKYSSFFFQGIIAVNRKLETWANEKLHCKNVIFLSNFVSFEDSKTEITLLKGAKGKRIVSLANLREQKNHLLLLEVAKKIKNNFHDWTFHLVGQDFKDHYSEKIKEAIKRESLMETVFLYGSKEDIKNILDQSEIALLTSSSEGLPVAILEYGYYGKAVITTDVGQINSVIKDTINGFLVERNNTAQFCSQLELLISNPSIRGQFGEKLRETINAGYTADAIIGSYLKFL